MCTTKIILQPVREITKWLRAHPKNSGSKTPKKKNDDFSGGGVPQKSPAEKLAELAGKVTAAAAASAGDQPRPHRYTISMSSPSPSNINAVRTQVSKQP